MKRWLKSEYDWHRRRNQEWTKMLPEAKAKSSLELRTLLAKAKCGPLGPSCEILLVVRSENCRQREEKVKCLGNWNMSCGQQGGILDLLKFIAINIEIASSHARTHDFIFIDIGCATRHRKSNYNVSIMKTRCPFALPANAPSMHYNNADRNGSLGSTKIWISALAILHLKTRTNEFPYIWSANRSRTHIEAMS